VKKNKNGFFDIFVKEKQPINVLEYKLIKNINFKL